MPKNIDSKNKDHLDIFYMSLVLELAKKGMGSVSPNPMVGAIVIQDSEIIGQGFHQKYGEAHAEINAINNCREPINQATLYVNLEPCSHQGKTSSCAKEIVKHNFKRVVIANIDPNPLVAGKGIEILKHAGLTVDVGILDDEAKKLNQIFFKYIQTKKPFVLLKSAMSLDGKIATKSGDSKWISCDESRLRVHQLRHQFSAILTGVNTIINDDPLLNTRNNSEHPSHPVRIILDPNGRTPIESRVLNTPEFGKPIIVVTENANEVALAQFKAKGIKIIYGRTIEQKIDLSFLLKELGESGIDSVMIEAGGSTNFECVRQNIINQLLIFISPQIIGGRNALTAFDGIGFDRISESRKLKNVSYNMIANDLLIEAEF